MMDFIAAQPLPGVWRLDERGAVSVYLIAGTKRAVLLDTGFDGGELPALVKSLTPLPVTLVHSHADIDHVSGDRFWPEALLHPAELFSLRRFAGEKIAARPLEDGALLALGGRTLEVLHTPGHTAGSLSLLDRDAGVLFSGDTLMSGACVPLGRYDGSPSDYAASLARLWTLRNAFGRVFAAHGDFPAADGTLDDLRVLAAQALAGAPAERFCSAIVTPERREVCLRRLGYRRNRCAVAVQTLGPA